MKIHGEVTGSLPRYVVVGSTILSAAIVIALVVFIDYWFSTLDSDESFSGWLREDWIAVSIRSAIVVAIVGWYFGTRKTVWDAMYADYSTAPDFDFQTTAYPSASGIMIVDDEQFEILTTTTEAGLVLSRPSGESLFFPWLKIKEIRVKNESGTLATVQIRRRVTIPLELELPWKPEFRNDVGPDVQYHSAAGQRDKAIRDIASGFDR